MILLTLLLSLSKTVTVTGYCLGPCKQCQTRGATYTDKHSTHGIAVSANKVWRAYPLGTRLAVPGYGIATVDDIGGGVKRNQIDCRFHYHHNAWKMGKKKLKIRLISLPKKKSVRKKQHKC